MYWSSVFAPIFTDRVCSYIRTLIASILIKDYGPFQQVWSCWIGVICHRYVCTHLFFAPIFTDRECLQRSIFYDMFKLVWFAPGLFLISKKKRIELRIKVVFHDKTSCILGIFQLLSFKVIEREKSLYCKFSGIWCNELFHLGNLFLP